MTASAFTNAFAFEQSACGSTINANSDRGNADSWTANRDHNAENALVPSASLNAEGKPRFYVREAYNAQGLLLDSIVSERHDGADCELRNFLDEILIEEMAFIDFEPGAGFAILTAATAPVPATAVCAVSTSVEEVLALDAAVQASGVDDLVTVIRTINGSVTVDDLLSNRMSDARELVVHAGIAGAVPAVVAGARSGIRDGRVGVVTWRCLQRAGDVPVHDEHFARDVEKASTALSELGFQHFAIAQVDDDVELVPLAVVIGNTTVISLSRQYLVRAGV